MMQLMQLERVATVGDYVCEVTSHGDEYGFVVYTECDGGGAVGALGFWL